MAMASLDLFARVALTSIPQARRRVRTGVADTTPTPIWRSFSACAIARKTVEAHVAITESTAPPYLTTLIAMSTGVHPDLVDDQPDAGQAARGQRPQERQSVGTLVTAGGGDLHPEHGPLAGRTDADRDERGHAHHPTTVPDLVVEGIERDVRMAARLEWAEAKGVGGQPVYDRVEAKHEGPARGEYYVGAGHSHPDASPTPSKTDCRQIAKFTVDPSLVCPHPVMIVVGGDPEDDWNLAVVAVVDGTIIEHLHDNAVPTLAPSAASSVAPQRTLESLTDYLPDYLPLQTATRRYPVEEWRAPQSTSRAWGMEPTLGFEPRTCCLRNSCSTAELCRPEGEYRP